MGSAEGQIKKSPGKLVEIAQRIQRQHPTTKRETDIKRLETGWQSARDRDQSVRDSIAKHLWQRRGQKGPSRINALRALRESKGRIPREMTLDVYRQAVKNGDAGTAHEALEMLDEIARDEANNLKKKVI